jgi:hypothetical protein
VEVLFEAIGGGVDPGVCFVGHTMKLQDDDIVFSSQRHRFGKVIPLPIGATVSGRRDQQGVVGVGFVSDPFPSIVRELWPPAASRPSNSMTLQCLKGLDRESIAGPCEGDGGWNPVSDALIFDRLQLFVELVDLFIANRKMVASVISDFKAIAMQLRDLLPRHVVVFVRFEIEPFGDEERRAEVVLHQ